MDWINVLTIVLPVIFTIIIGIFYNNRRIDDVNRRIDDMNHRINDFRSDFNQRFIELRNEIREIRTLMMDFLRKEVEV